MTSTMTDQRGLGLRELREMLELRQARKLDVVIGASLLNFRDGDLAVSGLDNQLTEDGFMDVNGAYGLTSRFQDQLGDKLGVHVSTLRNLRAKDRLDLWDGLVNGLLHGRRGVLKAGVDLAKYLPNDIPADAEVWKRIPVPADQRSFLARLITGGEGERAIARALLSQNFAPLEDLDAVFAVLEGVQAAGLDPATLRISGDISDSRMYLDIVAPEIWTAAEELLGDYRSPFDAGREGVTRAGNAPTMEERVAMGRVYQEQGYAGRGVDPGASSHGMTRAGQEPILMAGLRVSNSEVGNGRWSIVPTVQILKCWNGWVQKENMFARTHIGGRLEEGVVQWSEDTKRKELELVTAKTRDVVATALSGEYLREVVARRTEQAGKALGDPEHTIDVVSQRLKWSKTDRDGIWQHFEMGGQYTAGGVANAVTSYSQTLSADAAWELDLQAMDALALAAR